MFYFYLFIAIIIFSNYLIADNKYKKSGIHIIPFFTGQKKVLSKYFQFFNQLNEAEKRIFLERVNIILRNKMFIGRDGFLVTLPVKTLVSGSIVQLTFGLENYLLSDYKVINIYPDAYLNVKANKIYRGETNTRGFITFSWKHFIEGYNNSSDRLNVGLHETGHALLNTIILTNRHDAGLDEKLVLLDKIPESERLKLFEGEDPFFRDYAKTNIREFFAVAIECFFETPEDFRGKFPEFYMLLSNLLNQDPANKKYRTCGLS